MGRDLKKYLYRTIAIRRGSPLHLALLEDAEEHDVQFPTLIKMRLGEYYEGKIQYYEENIRGGTRRLERQKIVTPEEEIDLTENIDAASAEWPK